jgi:hypothetical protein
MVRKFVANDRTDRRGIVTSPGSQCLSSGWNRQGRHVLDRVAVDILDIAPPKVGRYSTTTMCAQRAGHRRNHLSTDVHLKKR